MYTLQDVIELTKRLVAIESTNVGTFEKEIGDFIYDWMVRETGVEVVRDEFAKDRFNVMALLPGEISDPAFVLIGHMDTVPVGEGWEHDPFACETVGDQMYGRGADDMKSGLAIAMLLFRDIVKSGRKPKHSLIFAASADEEDCMSGAEQMLKSGYVTKNSWVVDLDSVNETISQGHKGKCWYEIVAEGKAAHSSTPHLGVDAIAAMAEVVSSIRKRLALYPKHPGFGSCTVCFGTIQGGENTNMVSDKVTLKIDIRLAPPLTEDGCDKLVDAAIADAEREVPSIKITYDRFASKPCVDVDASSALVCAFQTAIREETGEELEPVIFTGYTDSGVIAARTGNINCVSYGATGGNIHKANEWVSIASLERVNKVITKVVKRLIF